MPGVEGRAVLNGKKMCSFTQVSQKIPRAHHVLAVGGGRLAVGDWRLLAVGGSWWWLAVGGWSPLAVGGWRLVAVGGWWRLAIGGWWSLGAVPMGGPEQKKI